MVDFVLVITNVLPIQNSSLKSNDPQHFLLVLLLIFTAFSPESDHTEQ